MIFKTWEPYKTYREVQLPIEVTEESYIPAKSCICTYCVHEDTDMCNDCSYYHDRFLGKECIEIEES